MLGVMRIWRAVAVEAGAGAGLDDLGSDGAEAWGGSEDGPSLLDISGAAGLSDCVASGCVVDCADCKCASLLFLIYRL